MPCDSMRQPGQTEEQRRAEIDRALADLERRLEQGEVEVIVGDNGALAFNGWSEGRNRVSDVCAYRALAADGSFALRQAIARAEAVAGRQMDENVVAAGVHSHDGGKTWHPGH